ncbi:MAG: methyltransferase domain-containing protein [bacterium]
MCALFTGEFFVPGKSLRRLEADHINRYQFASRYVAGKQVLDIACGTGYGSFSLINAGAKKVDGYDINDDVLEFAQKQYQHPDLKYQKGNIETFEASEKYDVITCFETIEHIGDHDSAISSLRQAMVDHEGMLIISSPNRPISSPRADSLYAKPRNNFHVREFTIVELTAILERNGFCVESVVYGQRMQPLFRNAILQLIYQRIFKPHHLSSSKVRRIRFLAPTYFVLIAKTK